MKKLMISMILVVILLIYPLGVFAVENTIDNSKINNIINSMNSVEKTSNELDENMSVLSDLSSRIREYVDEYKNIDESFQDSKDKAPLIDISIDTNDKNISVDLTTTIDEQLKNIGVKNITNTNFNINNVDKLLKDSSGSLNNNFQNRLSLKNNSLLNKSNFNFETGKGRNLSYSINDKNNTFGIGTFNLLSTDSNYIRKNSLGNTTNLLQTKVLLSNNNKLDFDVDKSNVDETSEYDVIVNAMTGGSIELGIKYFRKGLFKDYDIDKSIKLSHEISYSDTFKVPARKKNNNDHPDDNNNNSDNSGSTGVAITETKDYFSGNTDSNSNPSTNDGVGLDTILLLISIIGLLGTTSYKKRINNN